MSEWPVGSRELEVWGSPYLAAQAAYLRYLGTTHAAEVFEADGVWAVRTGVASNTENGVVSDGTGAVSAELARTLVEWFAERQLPGSWLCAEASCGTGIAGVLEAAGCEPERASWEMQADLRSAELRAPSRTDVSIERVRSSAQLESWLEVAGACDWFETAAQRDQLRNLNGAAVQGSSPLRLYIALCTGSTVGMAAVFHADGTAMLTASAVLESHRRRGIGLALALARVRESRSDGCHLAVLAPSPDGAELYRTLGFEAHRQPAGRWFYLPPALAALSRS